MAAVSYDLVIVGAGSGNALPTDELAGWRIAVVESDRFGGTCLNRGCIPSKMLVYTADVAQTVRHASRFGIRANWKGTDWPAIRERVFGRIDPLHALAVDYRCAGMVDVFLGEARFAGPKLLRVGDDELRADKFVLATGSRPHIPAIAGLSEVPYVTSDTVMRLDKLPKSMVVLGGGYIAAEMARHQGHYRRARRADAVPARHRRADAIHRSVRRPLRSAPELSSRKAVANAPGNTG